MRPKKIEREFWPVNAVVGHEMTDLKSTVFHVWWKNHPKEESGAEPLENLLTIPLLLLKYVNKRRKGTGHQKRPAFRQPPAAIRKEAQTNKEFWPSRGDNVAKIYQEYKDNEGNTFWLVKFFRKDKRILVRRSVVEYFFPLQSLTFLFKQNERLSIAAEK